MYRFLIMAIFALSMCFTLTVEARKIALLVGVDEYIHHDSLSCCVNDVQALKSALMKIGFQEEDIHVLVTGGTFKDLPTKKNIEQKVQEILASAGPSDMVFISLSGHGAQEGENVYFCPPDVEVEDLDGTCFSITRMMDDLTHCPAKFKLVVVDACRVAPTRSTKGFTGKGLRVVPSPPSGIALFQSCAKDEQSWEDLAAGNGFFTKNFVMALSGEADANNDGQLTLMEVCTWTTSKTKEQVKNARNASQRPFFSGSVSDFPLAEDLNVQKAKTIAAEAEKAMDVENYTLAVEKFDEALALCPRFTDWTVRRRDAVRLRDSQNPLNPKALVVPDNYPTIQEAYAHVEDGGTITIKPGKYELPASLVVNRNVTFCGSTGRAEDVIIDCPGSNAFQIECGSPSFQNLTVSSGAKTRGGFYVNGGTPKLFHCCVISRNGAGIYIEGEKAYPQVEACTLKDCADCGLFIYASAHGEFRDCEIYGNALAGIMVNDSGNPTVTCCKIRDGKMGCVFITSGGKGTFKNNTLENTSTDCKLPAWNINPDAGDVTGEANTPEIPAR